MYYPQSTAAALLWLFLGLFGGGTWPALRQAVKAVDYATFNLVFVPCMSLAGFGMLWLLSLPPKKNAPARPWGPGDWDGLWDALVWESDDHVPLRLAALSGACVSTSNFLLAAALPLAGLTRALPVFNGVAIVVGVSVNYGLEGNDRPGSLLAGVALILLAVALTFLSRGDAAADEPTSPGLTHGILSTHNLQALVHEVAPTPRPLIYSLLDRARGTPRSYGRKPSVDEKPSPAWGLLLSAAAGAVDGCWSSLTCVAELRGIDAYVTATYFCVGLLVPLPFFEAGIYFRDPAAFRRRLGRLTFAQGLVAACCGVLNIWGIVTYFVATHKVRAAVAFAIFLSTPLVSICLGALCFGELKGKPAREKALVAFIVLLYVVAVVCLAANALLPTTSGQPLPQPVRVTEFPTSVPSPVPSSVPTAGPTAAS